MEIWERIEKSKKPASKQTEIWKHVGKLPKKVPTKIVNSTKKVNSAKTLVTKKIQELQKRYVDLKKQAESVYQSDYLGREKIKVLSRIKIYGTSNRLLTKLDNPSFNVAALTNQINTSVQNLFRSTKNNTLQNNTLKKMNDLNKIIISEKIDFLDRRTYFVDYVTEVRRLHTSLYETHVSRKKLIQEFNNILENLVG